MKITKSNFTRIMNIKDLSKRKAKLQELTLSIVFHGSVWYDAMDELHKLNDLGIKTALEKSMGI